MSRGLHRRAVQRTALACFGACLVASLGAPGLSGCSGSPTEPPPELPNVPPMPPIPPIGAVASAKNDAALPRVPADTQSRMAASHVLVSYAGAVNALPNVTRSREEARARAEEMRGKLLAGGDFAGLAKAYSDDSTGPRGGSLGGFMEGTMVAPFEAAVKALSAGQVSDIVETPFGFHVIRRDALAEVHAKHMVVTWSGAERAPPTVKRSKDEAKARVEEAKAKLASGAPWADVVRTYSDGPAKDDGGDLGWFGRNQLAPMLDSAAFDLDVGATSAVVESPRGFHILQRVE
ncbi:MAG: peptidylprolyl isomerase [Pseudomonadota bacterium]|nr:peptidylprolyl isomerase [Pseudomonadota bacterium]